MRHLDKMLTTGVTAGLFALATGCSKKDPPVELASAPGASASSLAAPASAEPVAAAWRYAIDPKSTTHVDMPGIKEHIKGDTTAAEGTLDVVAMDLARSRGLVKIDLSTFATHTFGNDDDATQTTHARTWLEVAVGGSVNGDMKYAILAVRSIDGLSATDLTKVSPVKDGADDVRTVEMTVHGTMSIHGHATPKDAPVEVMFRYPSGAPADSKPTRIEIKSKQPVRVVLKEHDVRPRDPAGKLLDWTARLISKVAETADVTVDLGATPAS
jgi:YceI-like domain